MTFQKGNLASSLSLPLYQRRKESKGMLSNENSQQNGERNDDISVGGGGGADYPDQPHVHHLPSLHEEKF